MYPKIKEHYIDAVMEENTLASYLNLLFPFKTSLRILEVIRGDDNETLPCNIRT